MSLINLDDTIAAIATPLGESGIGIVRISGRRALSIADKIFVSKHRERPSKFKTYTTHYGLIVRPSKYKDNQAPTRMKEDHEVIDEVILTVMRRPRSYTREDVVEINCHGGIIPLRKTLELVLDFGARLAKPGEFTQRAFLNGRIDLAQAEAVLDIIRAKTDSALSLSVEQLKGGLSRRLSEIRRELLRLLTVLEANIDFPEENLERIKTEDIISILERIGQRIRYTLQGSDKGRIFRDGIKVVICGKPNAGKSSLLNALLRCERSIVTPIAGTTRDIIEDILDIKGIPIRIVDTAGIIEPNDLIERKAVSRSKQYIDEADLILLVFDGSKRLSPEDRVLMHKIQARPTLAIINKIDLKQKIAYEEIMRRFQRIVKISAKKQRNINLLEEEIAQFVFSGRIKSNERVWVSNLRHIQHLKRIERLVSSAYRSAKKGLSYEFISQYMRESINYIDEILGRRFSEELLDRIFSQFCIGK